ncbi:hypothetical protein ABK040_004545 [Willaertia magna]
MLKISITLICFIIVTLTSSLYAASVTNTLSVRFEGISFINAVADSQFYNNFVNKSVSFSTWFTIDLATAGQNEGLVGALGFSSGSFSGFGFFLKRSVTNTPQIGFASAIQTNKWYLITVVYTPDEINKRETVDLYLNGVWEGKSIHTPPNGNSLRPSLKFDDILTNAIDFRFGGAKNLGTGATIFYNGHLDDTKLYSIALSADYISQQYKAVTLDTAESGFILYYPFEKNLNDVTRSISGKLSGSITFIDHVLPSLSPPANTTTSAKPITIIYHLF